MNDYLSKPFKAADFYAVIDRCDVEREPAHSPGATATHDPSAEGPVEIPGRTDS